MDLSWTGEHVAERTLGKFLTHSSSVHWEAEEEKKLIDKNNIKNVAVAEANIIILINT